METTNTNITEGPSTPPPNEAGSQATGLGTTAAEAASTTVEGGKWVAAVGQEDAKDVASFALEQAGNVVGEVGHQARNLIDESKTQVRAQAQMQTDQMVARLRELGGQVQALAEGRTEDAGAVGDYARQAAHSVSRFAGRIEQRGFDGIVADIQRYARRKPGTFLLGAAVAGFGIGRLLRAGGLSASQQQVSGELSQQPHPPSQLADVTDRATTAPLSTTPTAMVDDDPIDPLGPVGAGSDVATPRTGDRGGPIR